MTNRIDITSLPNCGIIRRIGHQLIVTIIIFFSYTDAFAGACGNWRWLHPQPNITGPAVLGWNGTRLVGVGLFNGTYSSDNGRDWTISNAANNWDLRSVAGSATRWVAVGHTREIPDATKTADQLVKNGTIETSVDGKTWTTVAVGIIPALNAVIWTGGQFVAVGKHGAILTSINGLTWTRQAPMTDYILNTVANSDGKIVAAGEGGIVLTSPSGSDWLITHGSNSKKEASISSVTWTGSRFVAVGFGVILSSDDGSTWTSQAAGGTLTSIPWLFGVVSNGHYMLAWGYGKLLASTDGHEWSEAAPGPPVTLSDIVWTGSQFVAAADGELETYTSTDGQNWTKTLLGSKLTDASLRGLFARNDRLIAVGHQISRSPVALTSSDGESWSLAQTNGQDEWVAVSGNDQLFVAVGAAGAIGTSTNSTQWTSQASGIATRLLDIMWTGTQFVAVGEAATIITSADGITWQTRTKNTITAKFHRVLKTDRGLIVLGQKYVENPQNPTVPLLTSVIYDSTDGIQWTPVSFPAGMHIETLASGGPRLLATGGTMAMSSPDGITWTNLATALPEAVIDLIWNDDRYVGISKNGNFITTVDGTSWTTEPLSITGLTPNAMRRNGDKLYAVGDHGGIATTSCGAAAINTPTPTSGTTRPASNRAAPTSGADTSWLALAAAFAWRARRATRSQ